MPSFFLRLNLGITNFETFLKKAITLGTHITFSHLEIDCISSDMNFEIESWLLWMLKNETEDYVKFGLQGEVKSNQSNLLVQYDDTVRRFNLCKMKKLRQHGSKGREGNRENYAKSRSRLKGSSVGELIF